MSITNLAQAAVGVGCIFGCADRFGILGFVAACAAVWGWMELTARRA